MASFIIAIVGGNVVENKSNGLFNCTSSSSNSAQHWTIEYSKDNANVVAFQNASDGQYLRAKSGKAYAETTTGDKQWWTLEQGHAPGSCWIKCNDFPDAYLCNSYANYTPNNKVYMWPKQEVWVRSLLWYFRAANAPGWLPNAGTSGAAGDGKQAEDLKRRVAEVAEKEARLKDMEQKEAALQKKEQEIAAQEARLYDEEAAVKKREQDVAAKEAAQKKKADQLAAQKKDLDHKQQQSAGVQGGSDSGDADAQRAELQKKLDELKAAEKAFAAKEAAANKREQQNSIKENELKKREAEMAALKKREQQNRIREDELDKKEAELARKKAEAQASPPEAKGGASEVDLLKSKNENLRLQLKLKDLERQLQEARRPSGAKATPAAAAKDSNSDQLAKLKEENARLKHLIAQQVKQKQDGKQPQHFDKTEGSGAPAANGVSPSASSTKATATNGQPAGSSAHGGSSTQGHAMPAKVKQASGATRGPAAATGAPAATNGSTTDAKDFAKGGDGPKASPTKQRTQQPHSPGASNGPSPSPVSAGTQTPKPAASGSTKPAAAGKPALSKQPQSELERLRAENARLRQEQQELLARHKQGAAAEKHSSHAALDQASKSKDPKVKPVSPAAEDDEDAIRFNCGHVAYPPPRKLSKFMLKDEGLKATLADTLHPLP